METISVQKQMGFVDGLIIAMVSLLVIIAVFLALWNPATGTGLRDSLYNLVNDTDFTTTYGSSIRDGVVYLIDFVPLGAMLVGATAIYAIVKQIMHKKF